MPLPERPIIALGCPRSGTTLFQLMLHGHERIAVPPETRFLLEAYRQHDRFGDLSERANRRRLARWIVRRRSSKFSDLGIEPRAVVRRIAASPPTLGSCLRVPFVAYAERFGAGRWGDKRPGHYKDVDALLRLFPDAQFIHVVRDGRDAAASLMRTTWFKGDAAHAAAIWAEAMDYGTHNARRLRPDQWHELRYEDLVADPESVLRRLCRFLGEDYDPAMARPQEQAPVAVPDRKVWHVRTRENPNAATVGSYVRSLTEEDQVLLDYVLARRLRKRGYAVPMDLPRPPAASLASYAKLTALRRASLQKVHLSDRWRNFKSPSPLAAVPPVQRS